MALELESRKYKFHEYYTAFYKGFRTIKFMRRAKKKGQLSDDFIERIMLAVTQVNGCAVCSYAHTKFALEQGMSNDEIQKILSGDTEDIPQEQSVGVFFAQHYADTRGKPSMDSWQRVIDEYGEETALGILGATRMIMIGNVVGIPMSSFSSRLKKKPVKNSNVFYELAMPLSTILFVPVAFFHSLFANIFKVAII
ncbi:MAG: carboxymuconolactone decarboxylase family protein [Clostridiaceae bacterium]|nr:carboxymuconolactone decarboxylase family protein [Clostridiaceae bacterium]